MLPDKVRNVVFKIRVSNLNPHEIQYLNNPFILFMGNKYGWKDIQPYINLEM